MGTDRLHPVPCMMLPGASRPRTRNRMGTAAVVGLGSVSSTAPWNTPSLGDALGFSSYSCTQQSSPPPTSSHLTMRGTPTSSSTAIPLSFHIDPPPSISTLTDSRTPRQARSRSSGALAGHDVPFGFDDDTDDKDEDEGEGEDAQRSPSTDPFLSGSWPFRTGVWGEGGSGALARATVRLHLRGATEGSSSREGREVGITDGSRRPSDKRKKSGGLVAVSGGGWSASARAGSARAARMAS
mmetsp:Transcript_26277/g.75377  ORF Transcript_26277/g.75377 Transcript_26277/m.75377 type:complete len:240 (+) Transcript_26277:174-893(+)